MLHKLLFFSLALALAASCSKNTKETEPAPEPPTEEQKPDSKKDNPDTAEVPATDIYPGFQLAALKPEHRIKFVNFAKAELCPCKEQSTVSLDQCLRKVEGRCKTAMHVAELSATMYNAGFSDTDVTDKVTEYIDSTQKVHTFDLSDRPFKGNKDAKVTVVEFADFQCPHCKEASKILSKLAESHGNDFKVYYKHFPLSAKAFSPIASKAAVAAGRQGKFWEMHDLLFKHQKNLNDQKLTEFAQRIGLNVQKFNTDMQDPTVAGVVAADRAEGEKAKLTGTPTIYINGQLYLGDIAEASILSAIKAATPTN